MAWSETIAQYTQQLWKININAEVLQKIVCLLDLTRLNEHDNEAALAAFIEKAFTPYGNVAGVCVYPQFVRLVAAEFTGTSVKAVTVANFPRGDSRLEDVLLEIGVALENGAQEIDVVFPYQWYLQGREEEALEFVKACRAACGDKIVLKIIMETAAFDDLDVLYAASQKVLLAGADFLKTSTGKVLSGATLETAACLLLAVKNVRLPRKRIIGVKVSGGVRDLESAANYIQLADLIMGEKWVTSQTFRIGASQLIEAISEIRV